MSCNTDTVESVSVSGTVDPSISGQTEADDGFVEAVLTHCSHQEIPEIQRLKTLAEKALGEDFDFRSFTDHVKNSCGKPSSTMEASVLAWISEQSRKLH
jgi:hypothetical protein